MKRIIQKMTVYTALLTLCCAPAHIHAGGSGLEVAAPLLVGATALGAAVIIASPFIAAGLGLKAFQARKIKPDAARIKAQVKYLAGAAIVGGIGYQSFKYMNNLKLPSK